MPRLLIVDDDPVDRQLAAACLRSIGAIEVLEADDGEQALELMERDQPDLVITDLRMPKLDGLGLVQQAGERFPLVPIVVMTARGSEKIAAQAFLAGMTKADGSLAHPTLEANALDALVTEANQKLTAAPDSGSGSCPPPVDDCVLERSYSSERS